MVKEIIGIFKTVPVDFAKIEEILSVYSFTKKEMAEIANLCVDECFCEYRDMVAENGENLDMENMHSYYILRMISLLLQYGLDPNVTIDEDNALWGAMYIDAPNVGASVMRLLLEHGGDPNHCTPEDPETIFEYINFKVSYDEYTYEWLHTVQCWLVLMAHGACWDDGKIPLTMLNENSVEIFKNFEKYTYTIEYLPQEPNKYGCWIMHIYDKETYEEVAVYK